MGTNRNYFKSKKTRIFSKGALTKSPLDTTVPTVTTDPTVPAETPAKTTGSDIMTNALVATAGALINKVI